jgi:hypothetical protein
MYNLESNKEFLKQITMKNPLEFWRSKLSYFVLLVSEYYPILPENLDKFKDFWVWNKISCNPFIIWTPKLIEIYKYDLDWRWYCWHNDLPYIKQDDYLFYQSINWTEQSWQTKEERITLTLELYQKWRFPVCGANYNRKIDHHNRRTPWYEFDFTALVKITETKGSELKRIAENPNETFTYEDNPYMNTFIPKTFIAKHYKTLNWYRISNASYLPWSFEFIVKYDKYWNYSLLRLNQVLMEYALHPFLTDEFIENILQNQTTESIVFIDESYLNYHRYSHMI